MKKTLVGLMALVMIVCLSSAGLAKDLKSIELIYSNNAPAKAGGNIFFEKVYLPRINAAIAQYGYKLDVTMYHASSLYKYKDQVNAVEKGLIDITNFIVSWEEARAPLHMVLYLPMMGFTPEMHAKVWTDLRKNVPEFAKEVSKYQELFHLSTAPSIFNMNEVRRVPADFKGVKVSATGAMADFMKSIGATPLRIDAPDWYSSLDRGMIDLLPLGAFIINMWKIDEVAKVHVIPTGDAAGMTALSYIMSKRAFSRLPKEVQQAINDNNQWATHTLTKSDDEMRVKSEEKFKKMGNQVIYLKPEEVELWREAAKPAHQNWIKKMESKGLPGQKVYDETKRLQQKYKDM